MSLLEASNLAVHFHFRLTLFFFPAGGFRRNGTKRRSFVARCAVGVGGGGRRSAVGACLWSAVGGRVIIDTSHGHFDIRSEVGGGKRARRP